jgi:hypothetical protein
MRVALALACLVLVACERRTTALDLRLVPSADLSTLEDLRTNVSRLEYVIDSPGGLYAPDQATVVGSVSIEDADLDPTDLELVARLSFARGFPAVRIAEGSLPDVPLDIRVRGLTAEGVPYAEGIVRNVRPERGVAEVDVRFDVRPEHQPPRVGVLQSIPNPPCGAPVLLVVFSRPVDATTTLRAEAIRFTPGGLPRSISVDASGTVAQVGVPLDVLAPGVAQYSVEIGGGVQTLDGLAFDQVPTTENADLFSATFASPCR